MQQNVKYDYLEGNRELNLDLTLKEAEFVYSANDEIKGMADSGDLQKLHQRCHSLDKAVEVGYLKVTDHLERALVQITQTEEEIYQSILSIKGMERLRSHNQKSVVDIVSLSTGNVSIENFLIVEGASNSNQELQTHANTLKQLIGARAWVLMAKVHLLEEYVNKVGKDDSAAKVELRESRIERDQYASTYGDDV